MSLINRVKEYYYQIPDWMLQILGSLYYCIPQEIRYGSTFYRTIKMLKRLEELSQDEINLMIDKNFVNLINHAYCHVNFYKRYYDHCGVDISGITSINDISKLPFIDKDTIRGFGEELIADDVEKNKLIYVTTSGSTGNPVGFYQPQEITMVEWAYTVYIWSRVGYKPDSSRLVLRGKKLHPGSGNKNYYYDPLRRELSCNIFDMRDETMAVYCDAIEKYKPEFIHGYMSAIIILAKFIELKRGDLKHRFKAILATSENIVEEQRQYVEKIFAARVFSFYGHSERLMIAGECEESRGYHIEPLYGYCELIDSEGRPAQSGEIVATGFLNPAMPLIRYKTGDMAIWDNGLCSCGRKSRVLKTITGRWHQDMLINRDGAYVSLTALNIHSSEFDRIVRYKLIQNQPGKVRMLIQPGDTFENSDIESIKSILEEKSNHKILFEIELQDHIPIQKNGKYRIVDQKIELG